MGQTFSILLSGAPSSDGVVEFSEGTEKGVAIDFAGNGDGLKSSSDGAVEFFEGTEKRVAIDFAGNGDLRNAALEHWEEAVSLSKTKILLICKTEHFMSFLLSESSLIVYPGKVIMKTCGQTVPLNSISKILQIGDAQGLTPEWLWYSRSMFLEPDDQPQEYRSKETEVALCHENCGKNGDAYVLGPLTGDHWLVFGSPFQAPDRSNRGDLSVDIMMYGLPSDVQQVFSPNEPEGDKIAAGVMTLISGIGTLASMIGGESAEVCDYCFDRCGYSCNVHAQGVYFMVHCTPQEGCSYASFETNFGSSFGNPQHLEQDYEKPLNELVQQVLKCFRPAKVTVTVFADTGPQGSAKSMGGAPFQAFHEDYEPLSASSSYPTKHDYVATVAHYARQEHKGHMFLQHGRKAMARTQDEQEEL